MQHNLFSDDILSDNQANLIAVKAIPGLVYMRNFLTPSEELEIINLIDDQEWLTGLNRRVQHYGYKYDYRARKIDSSSYIGAIPKWLVKIVGEASKLASETMDFDQVIINEYSPGQGISEHIDCAPCFAESIVSVSLLSDVVMKFQNRHSLIKKEVLLERGSIVIISGESRYDWYHSIAARKNDFFNKTKRGRNRRVSLTLRKVLR